MQNSVVAHVIERTNFGIIAFAAFVSVGDCDFPV